MLRRCACVRANLRALLKTEKREASAAWMVVLSLLENGPEYFEVWDPPCTFEVESHKHFCLCVPLPSRISILSAFILLHRIVKAEFKFY